MLDDNDCVPFADQFIQGREQHFNIFMMQAGRRFVKNEDGRSSFFLRQERS